MTTTTRYAPASNTGSLDLPELGIERRWTMSNDFPQADIPEILRLLERAYNGGPLWYALPVEPADHFRWKYIDSPYGSQLSTMVDRDGHIIDFVGVSLFPWLVRGQTHIGSDGGDMARDPAWQGRKLSTVLQEHRGLGRHPDIEFLLGYITHPINAHVVAAMGWVHLANPVQTLERPFGLQPLLPPRLRRRSSPVVSDVKGESSTALALRDAQLTTRDRFTNLARGYLRYARSVLGRRPARGASDITVTTIDRFDPSYEPFLAAAQAPFEFIRERTLDYLNWRYCDPRAGSFTVRVAREGDEILGYTATRIDGNTARLADMLVVPNREDVLDALFDDAVRFAQRHGVSWLQTRLTKKHPYRRAAARAGFVVEREDAGAMLDSYIEDGNDVTKDVLLDPNARLHITYGDSDHM
ncbi:MAG: hypothetical protein R3C39_14830 [Dehalococcoidia bacterium]